MLSKYEMVLHSKNVVEYPMHAQTLLLSAYSKETAYEKSPTRGLFADGNENRASQVHYSTMTPKEHLKKARIEVLFAQEFCQPGTKLWQDLNEIADELEQIILKTKE